MEDFSEKQFNLVLSGTDFNTLAQVFDIAFRAKGIEIANPSTPISLLLKKIQETAILIPDSK